jgi:Flp pilus assembly protein TadG
MFAPRNRTRPSARARSRRGTASLEFAVTAPILFTLLFGSVELTRMNMIRNTANNAAYEAVRTCVVPGAKASEGVAVAQAS